MRRLILLIVLFSACSTIEKSELSSSSSSLISNIHFFNTGNAFCSIVTCPYEKKIFIYDCGMKSGKNERTYSKIQIKKEFEKHLKGNKITLAVSHADMDHNSLLPLVLEGDISDIFLGGERGDYFNLEEFLGKTSNAAIKSGNDLKALENNKIYSCGNQSAKLLSTNVGTKPNSKSMIVKFSLGEIDIILSGDAYGENERYTALNAKKDLRNIEILTASHHGSSKKGSNSEDWARVVSPKTLIYNAGTHNGYKHPRCEVVYRFNPYLKTEKTHRLSCYDQILKSINTKKSEFNVGDYKKLTIKIKGNLYSVETDELTFNPSSPHR